MKTYVLPEQASTTLVDHLDERFDCSFPKGTVTPKSEQEEQALEHLVTFGMATRQSGKSTPKDDKE